MAKFINVKGVGDINPDHVVMIVNSVNSKYTLVLSHGGRIEVTKTIRDKVLKSHDNSMSIEQPISVVRNDVVVDKDGVKIAPDKKKVSRETLDKDGESDE